MVDPLVLPRPQRAEFPGGWIPLRRLAGVAPQHSLLAKAVRRTDRWLHRGISAASGNSTAAQGGAGLAVRFNLADGRERRPTVADDESYQLQITAEGVTISANEAVGAQRALATLAQLADGDGRLPLAQIEDVPCFQWRGLMLDVARRFISLDGLCNTLDAMAFYKLNVLHLHLTDDQGFRFQSAAYPGLASAQRYSWEDLHTLVGRAGERGIRVVPELDMPGHATSWLCAHPEWGPRRAEVAPTGRFGPHPAVLNPADEAVYHAIDTLFGELAEVFPDEFLHIGGDEVNPSWWRESDEVANYMSEQGLDDAAALQAHFNVRVAELAAHRGKRLIGWDEVLNGGVPPAMVVQAWRGATARGRALAAGHDCVVSAGYYLDLFYPADVHHRYAPDAPEQTLTALEDGLPDDPRFSHVAAGMKWMEGWRRSAAADGGAILGAEACLWSELVTEALLPVRLWSRMPALADRFWSNQPAPANLHRCLEASLNQLAVAGIVDVFSTSQRLLRAFGVQHAQIPAVELLEPVKWYGRLLGEVALAARLEGREIPQARPYQVDTPLDRPVDALLPESFAGRRFAEILAQGGEALTGECEARLAACEAGPFAPELVAPVQALALLLRTVVARTKGRIGGEAARKRVAGAGEPKGEYLVSIAPPIDAWLAGQ